MRTMTLFTGDGVSLSPVWSEGRTGSEYVRLVAEEGKAITNGSFVTACIDVPTRDAANWVDCDAAEPEEELSAETALAELTEVLI